MNIETQIKDFSKLGDIFRKFCDNKENKNYSNFFQILNQAIELSYSENQWFIPDFVKHSIEVWGNTLTEENIRQWVEPYKEKILYTTTKTAGVIMPGNLPLAGFHDFICVLITGNKFTGKLSSKDKFLLPAIAEILSKIDGYFSDKIKFVDKERLTDFNFIIATGSDNTSRYFEYYFGKYPNIIRKNRNGVAVLSGEESKEQLENLAKDVFMYFGLGCRSISKIFVPENYNFHILFESFEKYNFVGNHHKYCNNYDFYKSIYLVNKEAFLDNGFVMLKQDNKFSSPLSVIYYDYYKSKDKLNTFLEQNKEYLQCISSDLKEINHSIPLGQAQLPTLSDYADNVDTINFIVNH